MSGTTRRKLRSEITRESCIDDVDERTAARTRPLSYDEIMCKRESKKKLDVSKEKAVEPEISRREETVRNSDHHRRDSNPVTVRNSRDYAREGSSRNKEENVSRVEETARVASSRKKEERVSGVEETAREARSRKKEEKPSRIEETAREAGSRRKEEKVSRVEEAAREASSRKEGKVSRVEETARDASSRKKEEKVSRVEETTREASSRKKEEKASRVEETRGKVKSKESHDVEDRPKDKHEKGIKNSAETPKNDSRGHGRNKADEHSRDDSKHVHEKRQHRDSVVHERHMERSKAPERESKRKDRGEDDDKHRTRDLAKKHDSGHRHAEFAERKEKIEPPHSRHDEMKSKRRRSRSRDRVADRGRSRSASPKTRKNGSSHGHDRDDHSSHSQRDRSRYHSDFDRKNLSNNGSGSHHRRHGGSSSGLGGYSPRKRKTEAAVKTPSPPVRSPERNSAGWDLPPSAGDGNPRSSVPSAPQLLPQSFSSKMIELAGGVSVTSNMGKSLPAILSNNLSAFKDTSLDSIQLTQATRPMRRLYIDNVPGSTSEKDIMEYFNNFLLSYGANHVRGTRPCISCMIHKEKGQALVEFLTPEDASAALSFDGKSLFGSIIKVRRPKDFIEAPAGFQTVAIFMQSGSSEKSEKSKARVEVVSNIVKDSPHKIFIGGIAEGISSKMMMEIVSAFGPLKAFHFEVNEDINESCAFLEYADQSVTLKACAGLNGLKLGGRVLTVAQAVPHISSVEDSGRMPFYGIPEHVKPLLEFPTQVLKLNNVLDQKAIESLSQTDLDEIVEDVKLECSRFGSIVSINVVKPSNIHTEISETKEVPNDIKLLQSEEEKDPEDHPLDPESMEADPNHGGAESRVEPSSKIEEHEGDIIKEGDHHDSSVVEPSETNSAKDVNEAVDQPQEVTMTDGPTIEDERKTEGSDEETDPSVGDKMDVVKSGDGEVASIEDMPELDTTHDKDKVGEDDPGASESVSPNPVAAENGVKDESACDAFEVGCILVEFRRPEASCMAAHCLHGRAFDDRVVTVEYVPLDAYRARFPK